MSGPGEDRWRGGRPFDQNRQSSSHRGPRDRNMGGSQGGGPRGGSSGAGNNHNNNNININVNNNSNNTAWGGPREQVPSPVGPPQEQHVPVRGFNAAESKTALRRDPGDPRPLPYKPTESETNTSSGSRPSGPWGSKPNTMANGKDFFLELRKQVTALRMGSNAPGV